MYEKNRKTSSSLTMGKFRETNYEVSTLTDKNLKATILTIFKNKEKYAYNEKI